MTTTDPDFIAALKLVYAELGIWRKGQKCDHNHPNCITNNGHRDWCYRNGRWYDHDEPHTYPDPMPPLTDALLAAILRRLRTGDQEGWHRWYHLSIEIWKGADPVEAAVLAFADYLRAKGGREVNRERLIKMYSNLSEDYCSDRQSEYSTSLADDARFEAEHRARVEKFTKLLDEEEPKHAT